MGAGAASTEAARAMVAMNEVYMLVELGASGRDDQVHERTERLMKFGTKGGVVTAILMDGVILYRTGPVVSTYVFRCCTATLYMLRAARRTTASAND